MAGMGKLIQVRPEGPGDAAAIREVNRRAFGQDQEADIVDALRANGGALLSLVATREDEIVGHVMYSPLRVGRVTGAALGPMAVVPEEQRRGIGTKLVQTGNAYLSGSGCPVIVVVGHPEFYRRFGFKPASSYGITSEWTLPDAVFMALVFDAARVADVAGPAVYRQEFTDFA